MDPKNGWFFVMKQKPLQKPTLQLDGEISLSRKLISSYRNHLGLPPLMGFPPPKALAFWTGRPFGQEHFRGHKS